MRYVSSVSGGSVAHGLLAATYEELEGRAFTAEAVDELVIRPAVARISVDSLTRELVESVWRIIGRKTRTELLADAFDEWFFHGQKLAELPSGCRFIFNAANLTTGARFGFERDVVGDYVMGRVATVGTQLRVADAVAASAAFPARSRHSSSTVTRFPAREGVSPSSPTAAPTTTWASSRLTSFETPA